MKNIKYNRISTVQQNLDRQTSNIEKGFEPYNDICSGTIPFDQRKCGRAIINEILKGEVAEVRVAAVDRLGRNVFDMQKTIQFFVDHKVQCHIGNLGMSLLKEDGTFNPMSKIVLDILSNLANLELTNIKERQAQGIAVAKAKKKYRGGQVGRRLSFDKMIERHSDIVALLLEGISNYKINKVTKKAHVTIKRMKEIMLKEGRI